MGAPLSAGGMGIWFAPTLQQVCGETGASANCEERRGRDMSLRRDFQRMISWSAGSWSEGDEGKACGIVTGSGQRRSEKVIDVVARQCHEVLTGIVESGVEGGWRGRHLASNLSMITMRESQCGQRWSSSPGSQVSSGSGGRGAS
jgi:hypothetical protein